MLDVGCGGGLLSESLARLGGSVTAIDPSPENIGIAQWHAQESSNLRIDYQCKSVEALASPPDELYDVVCCLEVLEHVNEVETFVAHLIDQVKPGGHLFLSTLNRTWQAYALAILGAETLTGIVPQGTHDWNKFITPDELRLMLQPEMTTIDVTGLVGDPYFVKWHLDPECVHVNYILCATKS